MELVKDTKELQIFKKRSGRYAVKKNRKFINGEDKVKVLLAEGLISAPAPKKEAPAEEAAAEAEAPAE